VLSVKIPINGMGSQLTALAQALFSVAASVVIERKVALPP